MHTQGANTRLGYSSPLCKLICRCSYLLLPLICRCSYLLLPLLFARNRFLLPLLFARNRFLLPSVVGEHRGGWPECVANLRRLTLIRCSMKCFTTCPFIFCHRWHCSYVNFICNQETYLIVCYEHETLF
jgi:hypothetical protein